MKHLMTLFITALMLMIIAPATEAQNDNDDKYTLIPCEGIGPFTADMRVESLIGMYGRSSFTFETQWFAEGTEERRVVVLFPDTKNAITFVMKDQGMMAYPEFVEFYNDSADWRVKHDITIGTTLEELVELNGEPISFAGFDWDYGGTIFNYNGGKLADMCAHLRLSYKLKEGMKVEDTSYENILGDQELTSESPDLDDFIIYVDKITVPFEQNQE